MVHAAQAYPMASSPSTLVPLCSSSARERQDEQTLISGFENLRMTVEDGVKLRDAKSSPSTSDEAATKALSCRDICELATTGEDGLPVFGNTAGVRSHNDTAETPQETGNSGSSRKLDGQRQASGQGNSGRAGRTSQRNTGGDGDDKHPEKRRRTEENPGMPQSPQPRLACPFNKYDYFRYSCESSQRYRSCAGRPGFGSIGHLMSDCALSVS